MSNVSDLPPGVGPADIPGNQPDADDIDPLDIALNELAAGVVPTPDDLLDDCGPLTCLYYATQTLAFAMGRFAGTLNTGSDDDPDDGSEPVQCLVAMTTALGVLNGACQLVDVYPPEAAEQPPAAL